MIVSYPIEDVWPDIVRRIRQIKEDCRQEWAVLDVLQAVRERRACFFCDEEVSSFAIVKTKIDKLTQKKVLFVWIAWGENGAREQNLTFLKECARAVGASRMEMESPRRGFERTGWQIKSTIYQVEV